MRVSTSSPQLTPQATQKVIIPQEKTKNRRNPLFSSASDDTHKPIKEKILKRRLSASTNELRGNSVRGRLYTAPNRLKFARRRNTNSEQFDGYLDGARLQLKRMSEQIGGGLFLFIVNCDWAELKKVAQKQEMKKK